jgi:phosphate transport system permease protein
MFSLSYISVILVFMVVSYVVIQKRFTYKYDDVNKPESIAVYYAKCSVMWLFLTNFLFLSAYIAAQINKPAYLTYELIVLINSVFLVILFKKLSKKFKAREHYELILSIFLKIASITAVLITALIFITILIEAIKFFKFISIFDFLFGTFWDPQAYPTDGRYEGYGFIPVLTGTLLITFIAIILAAPIGLFSAIYLHEYSSKKVRSTCKPLLEMLAGVPTVIYGYFAALTVGPFIRQIGNYFGFEVASESALAAGLVMGIMIIPYIMSLADDVLHAVPQTLRDAALALGSTKTETTLKILIPAALPGIMSAIILGVSRAIGETMIVTMAAGLTANLTMNPLSSVTTITVQIMNLLMGDQEFNNPKTLAAFGLGISLFVITLGLNILALMIVKKYRIRYE